MSLIPPLVHTLSFGLLKGDIIKEMETQIQEKQCMTCGNPVEDKQVYCSMKCLGVANGNRTRGVPRSEEIRKKISHSHHGIIPNEQALEKMRLAKLGKPRSGDPKNWKHTLETKLKFTLRKGEKAAGWKGGITPLKQLIRRTSIYANWRTEIFKRDNYTCLWCGANKKYLNVDHIKQFALILKENKIKTVEEAVSCSELWNINNGRTLCVDCHKETDTYLNKGKKY